jgi:ribosomal protein L21
MLMELVLVIKDSKDLIVLNLKMLAKKNNALMTVVNKELVTKLTEYVIVPKDTLENLVKKLNVLINVPNKENVTIPLEHVLVMKDGKEKIVQKLSLKNARMNVVIMDNAIMENVTVTKDSKEKTAQKKNFKQMVVQLKIQINI